MSGSVAINPFTPLPQTSIRLQDRVTRGHETPFEAGILNAVTAPAGQPFALAHIRDITVEVPADQAAKLQQLVGRRICLAIVDGKFRAGVTA